MKDKILCYGDSNTYGFVPNLGKRFNKDERWSGLLGIYLNKNFEVIEDGLNNRTLIAPNLNGSNFIACKHLGLVLEKIQNIKILIFAVGTNDVQFAYDIATIDIKKGLINIIEQIKAKGIIPIIIPPIILDEQILNGSFSSLFDEKSILKSKEFFDVFKEVALDNKTFYCNFNEFVRPSVTDGLHYDKLSHNLIAKNLSQLIIRNFIQ